MRFLKSKSRAIRAVTRRILIAFRGSSLRAFDDWAGDLSAIGFASSGASRAIYISSCDGPGFYVEIGSRTRWRQGAIGPIRIARASRGRVVNLIAAQLRVLRKSGNPPNYRMHRSGGRRESGPPCLSPPPGDAGR